MKLSAIAATLTVLALGIVSANGLFASRGEVISYPIQLMKGERSFTALAGKTTYVEIAQTGLDLTSSGGHGVDSGYTYSRFAVASQQVPQGWGVALMQSQVITLKDPFGVLLDAQGKAIKDGSGVALTGGNKAVHAADNVYAINVPAGTPAGVYRLQVTVRNNNSQAAEVLPLTVTVQ